MSRLAIPFSILLIAIGVLSGCAGKYTFTTTALAGDTVALPIGYQPELKRTNLTIDITPCDASGADGSGCKVPAGPTITYSPGDTRVRASVGMSPDPIAKVIVEHELNNTLRGTLIESATNGNKEYLQTMLILDLPDESLIGPGPASIVITDAAGATIKALRLDILPGTGSRNDFLTYGYAVDDSDLQAMERAHHYAVDFTGNIVPAAIQLVLSRPPESIGVGNTYPVIPRSDIKQLAWNDDGSDLTIILTPSSPSRLINTLNDFRFYVAGSPLASLGVTDIQAYDIDGNLVADLSGSTGETITATLAEYQ